MAEFFKVHQRAIERALILGTDRAGYFFRIVAWEPLLVDPVKPPDCDSATIVTFRRLPNDQYEPADLSDRTVVAEWNIRHKDTPESMWELPDLTGMHPPY